ncbi:precorrin-2 C(20)-methyltransferase [Lipingzhangella sp. LS1_29]|uniref:Precorrin-2 C(20)-methyltransferase n=1 Tax=Lipingzhangella rawalii TaxID=2055835 RepID=A0ABU2H6T3_9ACTN|nr:precorrin-2 C(20)-methyltransferase [Lipingzhangella rawalii]MDS1271016.1 precorrin-2 C(20)-methyltransferase [Lipingzhangella rawalii]
MDTQSTSADNGAYPEHPSPEGAPRGTGRLWGVGLGPGDPELVTVKAARLIGSADVVAYHSAQHGRSIARSVAEPYLRGDQIEEHLVYPVTTEGTDHPGGYTAAMAEFYAEAAEQLAAHLEAGRDVVVLAAGDPLFYSSYMHMHQRLAHRFRAEVVPGVTAVSGASAALGRPLAQHDETLTVLSGTLPDEELADRVSSADATVIMKLGRTFPQVRSALERAGKLDEAWYVERATTQRQRVAPLAEVDDERVPYFSLAMVPSPSAQQIATAHPHTAAQAMEARGSVTVVGLGPAGRAWMTPEARDALADAEDLVGYGPYLDRVQLWPGQRRHASGNQVESERAAAALELAAAGARVAVVSSGDPGVFAMAAAVLEVAAEPRFKDVPVEVLPGLTAAQAAAARAGAPLGHDFCVLSLSDRLKPWDVIESRLRATAAADLVLAIYNPASRSRTWQVEAARDLLLEHRPGHTPVVRARDVGGAQEDIQITTLAELDPQAVDMRCLLLVGSSTTQVTERGNGHTVVWTPRRYPASE